MLLSVCALLHSPAARAERSAKILHHYTLPPTSLSGFGLSEIELEAALQNGLSTTERPALGSGLQHLNGGFYLGVTDRGPTFTRTAPSPGRVFPLPAYSPTIVLFSVRDGEVTPEQYLPITVDAVGTPATGIPNSSTEDSIPFESPLAVAPLSFNPNGLDVEDIHRLRCGRFLVVDEYSPSLVVLDAQGRVLKRYTPAGKILAGAAYPVSDTLPPILSARRSNRGFEAIAVSEDERTAFVMTQSPLGPTSGGSATRNSRVLRVLKLDITDPMNVSVSGTHVLLLSPVSSYPAGNRPQDLKISAARSVAENKLLLLERSDEPGIGSAKLVLADLAAATDVSVMPLAQTLALEDANLNLAAAGIAPIATQVIFSNEETPELTDFKLEGLTILNRNTVAISNDNDFGVEGPVSFQVWVIRLADRLP